MNHRPSLAALCLAAALACAPVRAQVVPLPAPPAGCESVQNDRLVAGGPMRQSHAVELLRCAGEYRMRLLRTDRPGHSEVVAEQSLGRAARGATIELAGGACLMAGTPLTHNLVIHGQWRNRERIRFGAGLLGAWLPDEKTGTIRPLAATDRIVCQTDRP
jgi:hypothetical protein